MKKIGMILLALISVAAFAHVVDSTMTKAIDALISAYSESSLVQQLKQDVEEKYNVRCESGSSAFSAESPTLVTFTTRCTGEQKVKLTVESKYSMREESFNFEIKSYKVGL